jgi:hypothetical protein
MPCKYPLWGVIVSIEELIVGHPRGNTRSTVLPMSGPLIQERKKYLASYAGLFLFAVGLRAITALAVSLASGVSLRNLGLFYDGHMYILIARTLPALYSDLQAFFPGFPQDPRYITAWFPVYPAFIRLLSLFTGDLRLAALIAAWLAGGIAVVLFYKLAEDYLQNPRSASILFSFLPTGWLIDGSLALAESTLVCLLLACILTLRRGKTGWAAVFAALTVLAQKMGFLLLPILVFAARPRRRALLPCISAILAAAALQLYLWWLFGDPLINTRVVAATFGDGEGIFGFPFAGFITWMLDPSGLFQGMVWQRKFVIVLEAAFYIGVLSWALLRYSPRMNVFIVWLGVLLLFNMSLSGIWSFYAFPRHMSMASPAAIMLACHQFSPGEGRWRWAAAGLLLSLTMLWTVLDALDALILCYRIWTPGYFIALIGAIKP